MRFSSLPSPRLLTSALILLLLGSGLFAKRPNILFILTDDQRWDALGLAGSEHLKTPNMDRLGEEGIYFKTRFARPRYVLQAGRVSSADSMRISTAW